MSTFQPAGNYYDKYNTRNPIARRLMRGFLEAFNSLYKMTGATQAIEVGCGEGELSMRMASSGLQVRAFDIAEDAIREARHRAATASLAIDFNVCPLEQMRDTAASPLVVCCEVLEHLDDPNSGLETLEALSSEWLLLSVPREPIWRALNMMRGKYIGSLGNTPGHVNHWSRKTFIDFVASRLAIVEVRSPLPWTMLLCKRR